MISNSGCHFSPFQLHHCKVDHEVDKYREGKHERKREESSRKRGGGWDCSGGECRGEKQIWRLGWWECTDSHRCDVPLRNSRCEQIRLNARVSRKEPPSQQSIEGGGEGGGGRLGGWRYYCVKTSDPRHLHLCISCIKLWNWKMRDMGDRRRKKVD